jgi:addiction module HigA family antidote
MAIERAVVDQGLIDLSDVATKRRLPAIHPGRVLRDEFLRPLGITAYRLALGISVPPNRVTAIIGGKRAVTADTALRLGRYFATSAEFWLGLQEAYDIDLARRALGKALPAIKPMIESRSAA